MATLREIVTGKGWDATQGIIEEVSKLVPELNFFDAKIIQGTTFQGVKLTSLPTTGFRAIGTGVDASDEGYSLATYTCALLSGLVKRDIAAFTADVRGADAAKAAAAIATIRSAMKTLATAIWYGDGSGANNSNIFPGVAAAAGTASNVLKAGGSTASKQTSVFLVGNDAEEECGLYFGEDSELLGKSELEWFKTTATGSNNKSYTALCANLDCWAGFGVRNANSVFRIANLSTTDSKTLSDALLAEAVSLYQEKNDGVAPKAIFAPFEQVRALRVSRSAKVYDLPGHGGENIAGAVVDFDGIPIIGTSNISLTEAVVA